MARLQSDYGSIQAEPQAYKIALKATGDSIDRVNIRGNKVEDGVFIEAVPRFNAKLFVELTMRTEGYKVNHTTFKYFEM
jgi:hypothetical protein